MIGDTTLGEIIFALIVLALFWGAAIYWLTHFVRSDRDRHLYPTIAQAKKASDKQIARWVEDLPVASNNEEMVVIDFIVRRYIGVQEADRPCEMSARHRYAVAEQINKECLIPNDY